MDVLKTYYNPKAIALKMKNMCKWYTRKQYTMNDFVLVKKKVLKHIPDFYVSRPWYVMRALIKITFFFIIYSTKYIIDLIKHVIFKLNHASDIYY